MLPEAGLTSETFTVSGLTSDTATVSSLQLIWAFSRRIRNMIENFSKLGYQCSRLSECRLSLSRSSWYVKVEGMWQDLHWPHWKSIMDLKLWGLIVKTAGHSYHGVLPTCQNRWYDAGLWPNAFSELSIQAATESVDAFVFGMQSHPTWLFFNFTVPFSNGTADAELPGYLILPSLNSSNLPLYIITGGTDYPKEVSTTMSRTQQTMQWFLSHVPILALPILVV